MLCGFAALVLVFLPSLAALFLYPAGLMLEIMNAMTLWLQQLPGSYLWVKTPESFSIAIYYGALLLLMLAWQHAWSGRWSLGIGVLLLGALLSILWPASFCKYGVLEIVFLDVGQGDSILIKTPRVNLYCWMGEEAILSGRTEKVLLTCTTGVSGRYT